MRAKGRLRVIVLTRRYGGEVTATTTRLGAYAAALREEGAEVVVVTRFPFVHAGRRPDPRYEGRRYMRERIDGVSVLRVRLPGERFLTRFFDQVTGWLARLRRRRHAAVLGIELVELLYGVLALPLIAALRPSAVVVEQGPAWLAPPVWLLPRFAVPVVLQVSDVKSLAMERGLYGPVSPAQIRLNRRLEDFLYRRATAVVTVTEAMASYVTARLAADAPQVHLIPNGAEVGIFGRIDAAARIEHKRRLGLDGKFVALYAGTFEAAHDIETLLDAAERLRHLADVAFLLLGEGPLELQLRQTAARRRLANVELRAAVPLAALTPFLAAADVGISTEIGGLRDTVRSKLYLYMSGGLPVIVTDDGGESRALVDRAGAGFLVPPGDGAAIARRLLHLKRRPEVAAALGASGRGFVERHHDRAQLARRFARVVLHGVEVHGALALAGGRAARSWQRTR